MNIMNNIIYRNDLDTVIKEFPIKTGKFLITGATGLIGSCIIDALLLSNENYGTTFKVYALGRHVEKLIDRFGIYNDIEFIEKDVTTELNLEAEVDYIIHAASNADPKAYALEPVETILTNVLGAKSILDYCLGHKKTRVLLTSTFEVYGKHNSDEYTEEDYGVLNYNSIRSGYPESKRIAEILFRSYHEEYGIDTVIARLSSVYGPTMLKDDSKAHAQFIRNGIAGENIVLKSKGLQKRTYCYVIDAISGIFAVLFNGTGGEAYNVANGSAIATIGEIAAMVADICDTNVVFAEPDNIEAKGFSKPQNCVLVTKKIEALGWHGSYGIREGLERVIKILSSNRS